MGQSSHLSLQDHQDNRFAIYCGAGVYVSSVSAHGAPNKTFSFVHTGPLDRALAASRRVAIGALHEARRAGLNAWLVQHPARAARA